ncbi:MAG: oligopeptide transporter, OPT family [Candidatus Zixiibacteriota bacterium]|nr:MAG: oligopeptide transporter, OPT family [candidate division Zixibacteria bacterium]
MAESAEHLPPPEPSGQTHQPYVPAKTKLPELTLKVILLGVLFGFLFGATSVYLGLKIGLTVSASIPVAVLSISLFRVLGRANILENNMVQTIASAGESIGAGVVFTLPALFLMGFDLSYSTILILASIGGILGVLFMIPIRRSLIVKEHGVLPYPEGTACADVLIAGEKGGSLAQKVFLGLGAGFIYTFGMRILNLWKVAPGWEPQWFKGAAIRGEVSPELLGVGYIIGLRISGYMLSGGVLSWLVLIPLIKFFGEMAPGLIPPAGSLTIAEMTPDDIWADYIRYIGGGAVVFGGIITLLKALPTIWSSFRENFREVLDRRNVGGADTRLRTERDIPVFWAILGAVALVIPITFMPIIPGGFVTHLAAAVLMVFFGFFFVTVASRIVGLVGSSSSPISGMTITTLMITCLIFVALGWTGHEFAVVAIAIGGVVCIAAANGGATSQDLKTGYLVGATPRNQQIGLIIGVVSSSLVVGLTLFYLHSTLVVGSMDLTAPKAALMAIIVDGVLTQQLPWDLVLAGFFMGAVIQLCGVEALPFAVGAYLPMEISVPIFAGGVLKYFVDKTYKFTTAEAETTPGVLYSSGLIAGGAVGGILWAVSRGMESGGSGLAKGLLNVGPNLGLTGLPFPVGDLVSVAMFTLLCVSLIVMSRKQK